MTDKQTSALRLALEALEAHADIGIKSDKSITAIREALAERQKESPKFDPNESFAREEAAQARVREFMRNH